MEDQHINKLVDRKLVKILHNKGFTFREIQKETKRSMDFISKWANSKEILFEENSGRPTKVSDFTKKFIR